MCPTAVEPDHPDSYYCVSDRLAREIPGGWKPDQYANLREPRVALPAAPAPRCGAQTEGRITHFVAGIGTGGTITGIGRYLKEVSDGRVADHRRRPGGLGVLRRHRTAVPGRGRRRGLLAATYDPYIFDEIVAVSDADTFAMTRRLAREEAMLVGGSCGMAVVAALRVAAELARRRGGRRPPPRRRARLPRKIFDDDVDGRLRVPAARTGATVGDCCAARTAPSRRSSTRIPTRRSREPSPSCASTASRRCRWCGRAAGDGGRDRRLGRRAGPARRRSSPATRSSTDRLGQTCRRRCRLIGAGEPLGTAMSALDRRRRRAGARRRQARRRGHPLGRARLPRRGRDR